MARVAKISVELNLDDGSFTGKLVRATGEVDRFKRSVTDTDKVVRQIERGVNGFGASLRDLVIVVSQVRGAIATLHGVTTSWMSRIVMTNAEMERLTALMRAFSTAASTAAREQEAQRDVGWLRQMAKTAPYDLKTLTDAFVKFKAAGVDPTGGSLQALTDAVAAFGGTSDVFHRASIAIQQMAGKGVISMEELRQQLGEAVPNAINLMARAMGLSMAELVKKVSTGTVEARSALAKMFDEMERTFGGAAQQQMRTFNGQLALMRTTLNELLTTNSGLVAFFNSIKNALQEFNQLLVDPLVASWATELGNGLTQLVGYVQQAIRWAIEFRNEIGAVAKALIAAFVAQTVIGGLSALAMGVRAAWTQVGLLKSVSDAYLVTGAAMAGVLNSGSVAAYRVSQAAGVAGAAMTFLGRAVQLALGPIGAVALALYTLADAAGIFGGSAEQAAKDIQDGLISDRAVRLVSDRVEELKRKIGSLEAERDRLNRRPVLSGSEQKYLKDVDQQIASYRAKLGEFQQVADKAGIEITRRAANALTVQAQNAIGDRLNDLEVDYRKQIESIEKRLAGTQEGTEQQKAINKERLQLIRDYNAQRLALLDEVIAAQRQKLESADNAEREAAKKLYTQLSEQRQQLAAAFRAQEERAAAPNAYLSSCGKPEKLSEAEMRIASLAGRVADLRAEFSGAGGELAKLNAEIEAGKFKNVDEAQLARMRELAAGIDEWTKKLKEKRQVDQEHEQAWQTITGKWLEMATRADQVKRSLLAGDTEIDPKGLRSLEAALEKAKTSLKEGSVEAAEAVARINQAIADARFVDLGESVIDWRQKTREITTSLISDERAAREQALRDELERIQRLVDRAQLSGEQRKLIEEDVQAYITALRLKTERENESSAAQLAREWENVSGRLKDASGGWMKNFTDQLMNFIKTGKFEFTDLADHIISEIVRIQLEAQIAKPVSSLLDNAVDWLGKMIGGMLGSGGGDGPPIPQSKPPVPDWFAHNHGGGIVGLEASYMRMLPRSVFANAKRFHEGGFPGLRSDEVPTILKKGEGVFTPEQMRALGQGGSPKVTVNVINRGADVTAEQGDLRFDGEQWVLDVVLRGAGRPGAFREGLRGAMST